MVSATGAGLASLGVALAEQYHWREMAEIPKSSGLSLIVAAKVSAYTGWQRCRFMPREPWGRHIAGCSWIL
jgi:hypothetical protein